MAADPAGYCKIKFHIADSVGTVYPGIQAFIAASTYDQDVVNWVGDQLDHSTLTTLATFLDSRWTLVGMHVIMSNGTINLERLKTMSHAGSLTDHEGTRGDCVVAGWKIPAYYRGGKPRCYWPAPWNLASGSITHWDAAGAALLASAWDAWLAHVSSISGTHGVTEVIPGCIRRRGPGITGPTFVPYEVGTHVDTRVCSQRKRLGRL